MGWYESLDVRPVINAAAAQTVLGGSLMPEPVIAAMADAATAFVHLPELHDRVGERLAGLTRNEAACVTCGSAAGILVAVAAAMTIDAPELVTSLPDTSGLTRTDVVHFRGQRTGFLSAAREAGATLVDIGGSVDALRAALSDRTAAVLWFAGPMWDDEALPLDETIAIAGERGVPVIVDAADQIPPLANLWQYTREQGADLAIFSGGKGLRGPQPSGLVVGRVDLIRACRANTGHMHSIGRPAKVGKEEMVGLLAAVEWSLVQDAEATHARHEAMVDCWVKGLSSVPGIAVARTSRSHSGQPIPRALVQFETMAHRDTVIAALWELTPRIAVLPHGKTGIGLNPQGVGEGQERMVLDGLLSVVQQHR